jgi:hypothetical protein
MIATPTGRGSETNGEPLTVQKELMRHASIQTTLNTYGGGMMDSMREAHGRVVKQAMAR